MQHAAEDLKSFIDGEKGTIKIELVLENVDQARRHTCTYPLAPSERVVHLAVCSIAAVL